MSAGPGTPGWEEQVEHGRVLLGSRLPDGRPWTVGMRPLVPPSDEVIAKAVALIQAEAEQVRAAYALDEAKRRTGKARLAMLAAAADGEIDNATPGYRWPDVLTWVRALLRSEA